MVALRRKDSIASCGNNRLIQKSEEQIGAALQVNLPCWRTAPNAIPLTEKVHAAFWAPRIAAGVYA
ncbi:hypothetical protein D918_09313 [Trichuris suis]|nr:hypothetical protein D918_09313 [Trichuris suis]